MEWEKNLNSQVSLNDMEEGKRNNWNLLFIFLVRQDLRGYQTYYHKELLSLREKALMSPIFKKHCKYLNIS